MLFSSGVGKSLGHEWSEDVLENIEKVFNETRTHNPTLPNFQSLTLEAGSKEAFEHSLSVDNGGMFKHPMFNKQLQFCISQEIALVHPDEMTDFLSRISRGDNSDDGSGISLLCKITDGGRHRINLKNAKASTKISDGRV